MNLNDLAKEIAKREGLRKPVNIAQIKEVLRCLGDIVHEEVFSGLEVVISLQRAAKRRNKKK